MSLSPTAVLANIWQMGGLPAEAMAFATLTGEDPVFPSSFAVGTAAQTGIAAAALAACELGHARGLPRQSLAVDMAHAAVECTNWFSLDGRVPEVWDKFSGLYTCRDGFVRIHANFLHHREGALRVMGLDPATATREQAGACMANWQALAFEEAAAQAGLVVAAVRTFDEWDAHPQGQAIAAQPLMYFEKIGEAPPLQLPAVQAGEAPLAHLRVLDLTRILAGPVCGRALAAYGADVLLVNSPKLPNIEAIADTSRGKLSCHVDLRTAAGQAALDALVAQAHVFVQGYRPGALASLGQGAAQLAAKRPGIVCVSLSAYGDRGPWATRRGFDSLVQTATGFNHAEMLASGGTAPQPMPMQILDCATGHLMAFATSAALLKQQREGGSWHVRLSLAQTAHWLRHLGRVNAGFAGHRPDRQPFLETTASGFGELTAVRHAAQLSQVPTRYRRPSSPPGTHPPVWP